LLAELHTLDAGRTALILFELVVRVHVVWVFTRHGIEELVLVSFAPTATEVTIGNAALVWVFSHDMWFGLWFRRQGPSLAGTGYPLQ